MVIEIFLILISISMIVRFIIILAKYERITGIATGRRGRFYEQYSYEYLGESYVEFGWNPGIGHKKGKKCKIWVHKDKPNLITTDIECISMCTGFLLLFLDIT